jgi:MobA/VirD2-like, nuclease domain/TraI-like middle domain
VIARCISRGVGKRGRYTRLVQYLLDPQNKHERVGTASIVHCHSAEAPIAALEVEAIQAQNRRATGDKTYHLLISFPAGEVPSPEVLQAIEAKLCERLGFSEHQRVSVVHHDTDHLHVHVAVNKVHPTRLTLHTPYRDFQTLGRACSELEQEHGLQRVNHEPRRAGSVGAQDLEQHSGIESLVGWLRRECLSDLRSVQSWQQLHLEAARHGLRVQQRARAACWCMETWPCVRAQAQRLRRGVGVRRRRPRCCGGDPPGAARGMELHLDRGRQHGRRWHDYIGFRRRARVRA